MKVSSWPAIVPAVALLCSCSGSGGKQEGTEGGPCYPNNTCNEGLACYSNLCVDTGGRGSQDATPGKDTGATDVRAPKDQGSCQGNCEDAACSGAGCVDTCVNCADEYLCEGGGCGQDACAPDCDGRECGSDGCGGSCGTCPSGVACSGGVCQELPECQGFEEPSGEDCFDYTFEGCCDASGILRFCDEGQFYCVDCGVEDYGPCGWDADSAYYTCGTDGDADPSGEFPMDCEGGGCQPDCEGIECGPDGCGGSCGTCKAGEKCDWGTCVKTGCTPACAGKECGPDGCGGECGPCPDDKPVCTAGVCGCKDACMAGQVSCSQPAASPGCGIPPKEISSVPVYICAPVGNGCNCWTSKSCKNGQQCQVGVPDCVTAVDWVITSVTDKGEGWGGFEDFDVCYKDQGNPGNQDKFGLGLSIRACRANSASWPDSCSEMEMGAYLPDSTGATKCMALTVSNSPNKAPYAAFRIDSSKQWIETDENNNDYYLAIP